MGEQRPRSADPWRFPKHWGVCYHSGRSIFHSFFHSSIHGAANKQFGVLSLCFVLFGLAWQFSPICLPWGYSYWSPRVFGTVCPSLWPNAQVFRHIPLPRRVSRRQDFLIGHPERSRGGASGAQVTFVYLCWRRAVERRHAHFQANDVRRPGYASWG